MNNDGIVLMTKKQMRKAKFKAWLREKKAAASRMLDKGVRFMTNNPLFTATVIIPLGMRLLSLTNYGVRSAVRTRRDRVEIRNRNKRIYDPSAGHWWHLKRELSPKEWAMVDRRHKNGERYADIFSAMRVLK